jgi:hypothetical protein
LAEIEGRVDEPILPAERGSPYGQPGVARQTDLTFYGHAPLDGHRTAAGSKKVARNPGFRLRAAENQRVHEIFDLHKVPTLSAATDDSERVVGGIVNANVPLF